MRAAVVFLALIASATAQADFYLCDIRVPDVCITPPSNPSTGIVPEKRSNCMSDPSLTLQGTSYDVTTGFNVISFGDFNGGTSDTEGRVVALGNGNLGAGYSIGARVYTKGPGATDIVYPYLALFGGNLNWPSGLAYPDGSDTQAAAYEEMVYVGGKFTTQESDLNGRISKNTESIGSDMSNAQYFYSQLQLQLDAVTDNFVVTSQYGTCYSNCSSESATSYSTHVSASILSTCTSYAFVGCSSSASMVFNVDGQDNVLFAYGNIQQKDRDAANTVFNIMGSGRTITMRGTSFFGIILSPNNNYAVDPTAPGVTEGIVIVADVASAGQFNRVNCTRPTTPGQPQPCAGFESSCSGTTFDLNGATDTREYNVISFNNFIANTGDVEGRVMTKNNFQVGNGYSVGYILQTENDRVDRHQTYSVIAGGSCTIGSGAIYPDGSNLPYPGEEEGLYCGGTATLPADLAARATAGAGSLDTIFAGIYTCYSNYSTNAASSASNVVVSVEYDALTFTCNDANANAYFVNIDASMFLQATYYTTPNCNFQADWTINIVGSGDVVLTGGSFPAPNGAVVYNVIGSRTVYVYGTALNGHLLAVDATLNQTGGVILGKVVVGDVVMSLQINKEDTCVTFTVVNVPVITNTTIPSGNTSICTPVPNSDTPSGSNTNTPSASTNTPSASSGTPSASTGSNTPSMPNDLISYIAVYPGAQLESSLYPNATSFVGQDSDGCGVYTEGPISEIAAGTKVGSLKVPSYAGGKAQIINGKSSSSSTGSASTVAVSVAILAIALLF